MWHSQRPADWGQHCGTFLQHCQMTRCHIIFWELYISQNGFSFIGSGQKHVLVTLFVNKILQQNSLIPSVPSADSVPMLCEMNPVTKQRDLFKSVIKLNSSLCLDQYSILYKPHGSLSAILHDAAKCSEYKASENMNEWEVLLQWHWQEKTNTFRGKPVPVPLCPPKIPQGLLWDGIMATTVKGQQKNCLSHGTAITQILQWHTAHHTLQPPVTGPSSLSQQQQQQ